MPPIGRTNLQRCDGIISIMTGVGVGLRRALSYAAAGLAVLALAGCSGGTRGPIENTYPVTPGHIKHKEVLGSGRVGSQHWTLLASVDGDGQLCMGVRWQPPADPQDYGCGFGNWHLDRWGLQTWPVETAQGRRGATIAFAPSPAGAVTARLRMLRDPGCHPSDMARTEVRIVHRVPAWYPLRGAGWFTTPVPAEAMSCLIDVQFLNRAGRIVPEPRNF